MEEQGALEEIECRGDEEVDVGAVAHAEEAVETFNDTCWYCLGS